MHRSTPSECWFLSCSQWVWQSSADSTFSVYEDEGEDLGRGTKIVLTLKAHTPSANRVTVVPLYSLDLLQPPSGLTVVSGWCTQEDCLEFLEEERLKGLIKRYSEFINFPIYLYTTKEEEEEVPIEEGDSEDEEEEEESEEDGEESEEEDDSEIEDAEDDDVPKTKKVKKTVNDWELVNDAKALWTRNPSDITDEEYKSFYQSLTKDFGEPLTHTHFSAEGEVEFKSILFIPKEAPHDAGNVRTQTTNPNAHAPKRD